MNRIVFCAISILIFCSCGNGTNVKKEASDENLISKKADTTSLGTDHFFDYSNTALPADYVDSAFHVFSDENSNDKFTFFIPRGNLKETKAILVVRNANNDTVFTTTFETWYMLTGEQVGINNDEQMLNYVVKCAKSILDSSAFVDFEKPGQMNQFADSPIDEFENYEVFAEVKEGKRSLFVLFLLDEDVKYYGYSKKLMQTKVVFACC
jgi:hypothetical protein